MSITKTRLRLVSEVETKLTGLGRRKLTQKTVGAKPAPVALPKAKTPTEKLAAAFIGGKESGAEGNYRIIDGCLIYRAVITEERRGVIPAVVRAADSGLVAVLSPSLESLRQWEPSYANDTGPTVKLQRVAQDVLAIRLKVAGETVYLGNSSGGLYCGRRVSFGNESYQRGETPIQAYLSRAIPMLPFSALESAGLNPRALSIVDQGPAETLTIAVEKYNRETRKTERIAEKRHFTGARLFSIGEAFYLFDVDRREVSHKIFNAFMVRLPRPARTVAEAYDSLKPDAVRAAEASGVSVLRQGEFFFIPRPDVEGKPETRRTGAAEDTNAPEDTELKPFTLRAGPNRPNTVPEGFTRDGVTYVRGTVEHTGREHAGLKLGTVWHIPVANTASESFTITGDID